MEDQLYLEYRAAGECVAHEDLEVGSRYRFVYYDEYIGELLAMSETREDLSFKITKVNTEDIPMFKVGDTIEVFDINVKERVSCPQGV